MNAVEWNRDLTRPIDEVRGREEGMTDRPDRAKGVLTFEEMRRGEIGLCVATQIARYVAIDNKLPGWHSPEIAWSIAQGQLAWYREMERIGQMVQIVDRDGLNRHVELWKNGPPADAPIGYILSLEGADSIVTLDHLHRAHEYGLRALGMILDATHLTDDSFWEALDIFNGPVWASHNNCRALVPFQRQFNDDQLKALIERGGVIGGAFDAWMMYPDGWVRGKTKPEDAGVKIEWIVDHIDHICQMAGSSRHCGIGSDLDGGFGREQCPVDLHTIADLQSLVQILGNRGYSQEDIEGIMHGNWIRFLNDAWSD